MKKRILFMIVVLVSAISTTFAKDHSKEYQKLLKKYDVDIVARDVIGGEDFGISHGDKTNDFTILCLP